MRAVAEVAEAEPNADSSFQRYSYASPDLSDLHSDPLTSAP